MNTDLHKPPNRENTLIMGPGPSVIFRTLQSGIKLNTSIFIDEYHSMTMSQFEAAKETRRKKVEEDNQLGQYTCISIDQAVVSESEKEKTMREMGCHALNMHHHLVKSSSVSLTREKVESNFADTRAVLLKSYLNKVDQSLEKANSIMSSQNEHQQQQQQQQKEEEDQNEYSSGIYMI